MVSWFILAPKACDLARSAFFILKFEKWEGSPIASLGSYDRMKVGTFEWYNSEWWSF